MGKNKKVKIIIAGLALLVVGGFGLIVIKSVQDNQALQNSEASGFGKDAITVNFQNVERDFGSTSCENFFSKASLTPSKPSSYALFSSLSTIKAITGPISKQFPKSCIYDLGNGKKIYFGIFTYSTSSRIPDSQGALFTKIQSIILKSIIDGGNYGGKINYFFGPNKNDKNQCSNLIFHSLNDFEYAYTSLSGFGQDCAKLKSLNTEITDIVSDKILNIMNKYSI